MFWKRERNKKQPFAELSKEKKYVEEKQYMHHQTKKDEIPLSTFISLPRLGKTFPKTTMTPRIRPATKTGTKIFSSAEMAEIFEEAKRYEDNKVPMHDVYSVEGSQEEPYICVTRYSNMRRSIKNNRTVYDFGYDGCTIFHFIYEDEFSCMLGTDEHPLIYCKEEDALDAIDSILESLVSKWESQIEYRKNKIKQARKQAGHE